MTFKSLVETRRSCRAFSAQDVSDDQVQAIIEAGCWAPSPLNLQPWEFVLVTDTGVKAAITEAAEKAKAQVAVQGGPGWAVKYSVDFAADAPLHIIVTYDSTKGGLGNFFGQPHGALQAASACIQNMMLAAEELGLGTLWFTFVDPLALKTLLDIPEHLEIAGIVMVGKPAGTAKSPPRKAPRVHRQRYGGE